MRKRTQPPKPRGGAPVPGHRPPVVLGLITALIVLLGLVAGAGGAKSFLWPPPPAALGLLWSVLAIMFFVVGACVWFVASIFGDHRFVAASPAAQVRLASQALAPILTILGLLPRFTANAAAAS